MTTITEAAAAQQESNNPQEILGTYKRMMAECQQIASKISEVSLASFLFPLYSAPTTTMTFTASSSHLTLSAVSHFFVAFLPPVFTSSAHKPHYLVILLSPFPFFLSIIYSWRLSVTSISLLWTPCPSWKAVEKPSVSSEACLWREQSARSCLLCNRTTKG